MSRMSAQSRSLSVFLRGANGFSEISHATCESLAKLGKDRSAKKEEEEDKQKYKVRGLEQ
jgi:hypothetical protein